jgi:nucleoside-diphosphate-sugar epimerase
MQGFRDETELEEFLSRPTEADVEAIRAHPGDVLILGAGGKMGPSLAMRVRRAMDLAGSKDRVIAASRFSELEVEKNLEACGVEICKVDLLESGALDSLPDAPNVLYLAGRKFGSSGNAALTWAMNVLLPGRVVERFAQSRIAALSSGNIYPLVPANSAGANEETPVGPVGEYAQSVLGRERAFEYGAQAYGARVVNLRLNYALEPRYGVLADLGLKVWNGETIDVSMPAVNFIWQGDANSYVLQSLRLASSPAAVLNIAGPDIVRVREIVESFSKRWNRPLQLEGTEAATALLNDGSRGHQLFGPPSVHWKQLLDWTAHWIESGGRSLGKPTHFEARDGKF